MQELERLSTDVLVTGTNPHELRAWVAREYRAGRVVARSMVHEVEPGTWGVRVERLRPARRAWVRPAVVATGAVTAVGLLAAAGWWLVSGVGVALLLVLLAFGALLYGLSGTRSAGRGCTVEVRVTHRHR